MFRARDLVAAVILLALATAATLPAVAQSPAPPGGSFVDDDGLGAERYIEAVVAAGLLGGCDPSEPTLFCPFDRAGIEEIESAVSAVLGRAATIDCPRAICSDVSVPVSIVQSTLGRASVTSGSPITRASLAVVLSNAADLEVRDVPDRRAVRIAATGDILPHSPVMAAAAAYGEAAGLPFDFRPMFADVAALISEADLALCHLETPLSVDDRNLSSYPVFYSPREVADAVVAAGYDGCSTASNHSFDQRVEGVLGTLKVVDEAGLGYAGTAAQQTDRSWWLYEVNGIEIAHLSYTYGLNGFRLPADQPWLVDLIDPETMIADAAEARLAGAELVVVSIHWGNEYQVEPNTWQRDLAATLLPTPEIDLIIGHHAHVVQGVEKIDLEYVVYGLGNLVSNQFFQDRTQDGVVALIDIVEMPEGFVSSVEFVPTRVERGTFRIVPVPYELEREDLTASERADLEESWERTADALSRLDSTIRQMVLSPPEGP
jgi:poly-gamma-glutamate synthesis protein (capsule biosynthesis protein)